MATNTINLANETWTEIMTASGSYQVIGDKEILTKESNTQPTNENDVAIALPKRKYSFVKTTENLWAFSQDGEANVTVEV